MQGKPVAESQIIMTRVTTPLDANIAGNVHGGVIMKMIDEAGGTVASRHTRCNAVTASIDRMDFHHPVFIGNLLTLKASLNYVGRTSMEIGVRVEAEDIFTGEIRHTASAYLTYVALDDEAHPVPVPPLILQGADDIRRHREAQARREARLSEKQNEKKAR